MDWRIYYDDESTLSGDRTTRIDVRTGVVAVAERDRNHNWMFWFGRDRAYYLLQNDGYWMGVDQAGFEDQMVSRCEEIRYCLRGRTVVPQSRYEAIINRMMRDCKPQKTGWHANERA
jgi:hypothetical protein